MQPPPPSHNIVYERNSVHRYDSRQNDKKNKEQSTAQREGITALTTTKPTTSENEYAGNNLHKRRRTGDDLLDAFLEIS